jgi:D-beta-D-heptose 7-phosphate kinase/D-beta-D-heptose 1-phosphate adenosyltransferase
MKKRKTSSGMSKELATFTKARILVVGDIMMDRFIWGRVSRISPEAPVPVVLVEKETFLLGGAANVVNNVHSLGGHVTLCGVIGDDEMGQRILNELNQKGVDIRGVIFEEGRQTTAKTRIIAHQQQVVRIDRETTDSLKSSTLRDLARFIDESLREFDGIILSDYGKGLLTKELIKALIQRAGESKKFVMVDPKLKNFFFYRGATVITPNTGEASAAAGVPITDFPSLKRVGKALLKRLRCKVLVITRGEEGMALFEPNQDPYLVPTVAKEVYDVTGAGDTVIGTMALAMAAGFGVREAARLANHAAGIVVGKVGTATVTQEELARAIQGNL